MALESFKDLERFAEGVWRQAMESRASVGMSEIPFEIYYLKNRDWIIRDWTESRKTK